MPLQYTNPQGASATFSKAQANKTAINYEQFLMTRRSDYALHSIDSQAIMASANDDGSFVRGLKNDLDSLRRTAIRSLARSLFRGGTGSIGQVNATVTGTTLTLTNVRDIVNFEKGMVIQFAATDGGTLRDSGEEITIVSVDRGAGSMVVLSAAGGSGLTHISALAENDYIVRSGDNALVFEGLRSWIPSTVAATSFYGVDRTADSTRLGGLRLDASAMSIEEGLIQAAAEVQSVGGMPDMVWMNPIRVSDLIKELGDRRRYSDVKSADGNFGFKALTLATPAGEVNVASDQNCQINVAWMLQSDTWELKTLGDVAQLLSEDGNQFLRESTSDSYEIRIGTYGNTICTAPGWNIAITLPTAT